MYPYLEVNTENELLCYLPSGKLSAKTGLLKPRKGQKAGLCWLYAAGILINSNVHQIDPIQTHNVALIKSFRKAYSNIDTFFDILIRIQSQKVPLKSLLSKYSRDVV